MKKLLIQLLSLLLTMCMVLTFAGCENQSSGLKNDRSEDRYEKQEEDETEDQTEDEGNKDIHLEEEIPELDMETAQNLIQRYNTYCNFGVCDPLGTVADAETAEQILLDAGYDSRYLDSYTVYQVSCCNTLADSLSHIKTYIGESLVDAEQYWENAPIEYSGKLYTVVAAMGYGGYYLTEELIPDGGKKTTVTALYDYEETEYTAVFEYLDGNWKLTDIQ